MVAELESALKTATKEEEIAEANNAIELFKPTLPSEIRKFGWVVFLYPITSVIVEGLFSHMTYNQAGSRSRLTDDRCVDVIGCKSYEPIDKDATAPLAPPQYNWEAALAHKLPWA